MQPEVYPYALRVDAQVHHVLWESGETSHSDRVLATGDRLLSFPTEHALRAHAERRGIALCGDAEDVVPLDIDLALVWLGEGAMPGLDVLLQVWNIAGDVARGTGQPWHDRSEDLDHVYERSSTGTTCPP